MSKKRLIRPPGAVKEEEFLSKCIRCGKCAQICIYNSIKIGTLNQGVTVIGTPYIVPRESPCYLCEELPCIKVCPSGALEETELEEISMGVAEIDRDHCYTWIGDMCRVCYANCPKSKEALLIKEINRTFIEEEECLGCGICEYLCVRQDPAIKVKVKVKEEQDFKLSLFRKWFKL